MKATIRDNIIFGEPFRPRRYENVLISCCLKQDIDLMPDGDMTEIGTNGLNLSGGQRQRITIARALYSSANVVIMVKLLNALPSITDDTMDCQCVISKYQNYYYLFAWYDN